MNPITISADVVTGCDIDVQKTARQILNRSNAHRTVPKQECMVQMADLPLMICTETIAPRTLK